MPSPSRSDLLQRRFAAFGVSASKLARRLPTDAAGQHVSRQLVKAAMSAGANYSEARDAESNSDYIHKVKICLKELRESAYWIEVAKGLSDGRLDTAELARECSELTAICVVCLRKARGQGGEKKPQNDGE